MPSLVTRTGGSLIYGDSTTTYTVNSSDADIVVIYTDSIEGRIIVDRDRSRFRIERTSTYNAGYALETETTATTNQYIVYNTGDDWVNTGSSRIILRNREPYYVSANEGPFVHTTVERPPKRNLALEKKKEKDARKALKKGVNLVRNMFGSEQINAFLSGNSFTVEGKRYNYIIKSKNNLIRHTKYPNSGHIPYHLEVVTKEGLILGSGCTVFKNTPVIDQLIAFIMHIKNNEDYVLQNMNITRRTSAFRNDSWLSSVVG